MSKASGPGSSSGSAADLPSQGRSSRTASGQTDDGGSHSSGSLPGLELSASLDQAGLLAAFGVGGDGLLTPTPTSRSLPSAAGMLGGGDTGSTASAGSASSVGDSLATAEVATTLESVTEDVDDHIADLGANGGPAEPSAEHTTRPSAAPAETSALLAGVVAKKGSASSIGLAAGRFKAVPQWLT